MNKMINGYRYMWKNIILHSYTKKYYELFTVHNIFKYFEDENTQSITIQL